MKEKRLLLKQEKIAKKLENNNNSDEDCKHHGNWKSLSKEEVNFQVEKCNFFLENCKKISQVWK